MPNVSQDLKYQGLRRRFKWQGQGWYWFIIETLRNEDSYKLVYSDLTFESLADDMLCTPEEAKTFLDYCVEPCHLFNKDDTHFWSERLKKDMAKLDDKREKTRMAGKISAEKRFGKPAEQLLPSKDVPWFDQGGKSVIDISDELRTEFSDIDIGEEFKKFTLYWSEGKRKLQRPKTAFRNWLVKAREFKQEKQPAKPVRRTFNDGNTEGMKVE